jgi:hypothetical protein
MSSPLSHSGKRSTPPTSGSSATTSVRLTSEQDTYLGQAYLGAGYPAEASAEFDSLIERRSETAGMFFDDVPTWRYTASLNEWKEKAGAAISNMTASNNTD